MSAPLRTALLLLVLIASVVATAPADAQYDCEQWQQLAPEHSPPKRFGHQMVYDSDRRKMVLWGGETVDPVFGLPQYLEDTWEFDYAAQSWTEVAAVDSPSGRTGYAMAYDSDTKRVFMYGGQRTDVADSIYAYDPATHAWRFQTGTPFDVGVVQAAMAYDPIRHQMVVFGGRDDDHAFATTLVDFAVVAPAHSPSARVGHTMVWSPELGGVLLYGGESFGDAGFGTDFEDLWLWNGADWTFLGLGPTRTDHGAVWDTHYRKMIAFGGTDGGTTVADVVFRPFDGDFSIHATTDGPAARGRMAFAWDEAHDVAIMFGGKADDTIFNATWTFGGRRPTLKVDPLSLEAIPCGAQFFGFTLDEQSIGPLTYQWQRLVGDEPFDLHDNVRMTGTSSPGLEIHPVRPSDSGFYRVEIANDCGVTASSPFSVTVQEGVWGGDAIGPTREIASMAYDSDRGTVVLFGGFQSPGEDGFAFATENDTWEYDGTVWTRAQKTSVLPGAIPGRNGAAMAYDPVRHVTVMFGGHYGDSTHVNDRFLSDTWEWDGSSWTFKGQGPGPRFLGKMVWDSERQRIELYGGRLGTSQQANDLWEWDGTTWTARTTSGGPPFANENAAVTYDDLRHALVVQTSTFGAGVTPEGQTWDLVAGTWTLRGTTTESSLMNGTLVLAFDAARGHPIGLGVHSVAGDPIEHETWEMTSPGTFRRMNVSQLLPARSNFPMVYDTQRHREVIESGRNLTNGSELLETRELAFVADPLCGVTVCGDGVVDPSEDCDPFQAGDVGCCHDCSFRPEFTECGPSQQCDDAGHCLFTTCGNDQLDPGEECDFQPSGFDAFFDTCCNLDCTNSAVGTPCYNFPGDGKCNAAHECVSDTCGNGIVDSALEQCDNSVFCCTPNCRFATVGACGSACNAGECAPNPGGGAVCNTITHDTTGCSGATSAAGFIDGAGGGTLTTPDGSASLTLPPGVGSSERYAIGAHLATSEFSIGTATTLVLAARFDPSTSFAPPGATLTLHWVDADDDGVVDGAGVDERSMQLFHNGAGLGVCGTDAGCNRVANSWTFHTLSFSEFTLAGSPPPTCATFTKPKLALGKELPPVGDDTLTFTGALPAPATPPDPDMRGLAFRLEDAMRTVLDVTIPAGLYDKASKIGWKVDKKRTRWTWSHPKDGAQAGIIKVTLAVKKGVLHASVKGARGDFAATAPLGVRLTLPASNACGATRFDADGQQCKSKSKGKALACK